MEVEDQIELAHVSEIFVKCLNKHLHELQHNQLIVVLIDDGDEVKAGVSLVYDFIFLVIQEIAHFRVPCDDQLVDLSRQGATSLRIRCLSDCDKF